MSTLAKTYSRVMHTCATTAALVAAGYIVGGILALSDGPHGIEIPSEVNLAASVLIVSCAILSAAAWIIDRRIVMAVADLRPLIRAEIERAVSGQEFLGHLGDALTVAVDPRLHRVAEQATQRGAAQLREIVTGEIMADVINSAVGRAHRSGMVMQAQSVAPKAVAPVVHMRTMTTGDN